MKTFNQEIEQYVRYQLLSWLVVDGVTSEYDWRVGMVLTKDAEADRYDFIQEHGDGNCSCFISPPCSSCTHPGNPSNQEEDDSCWEYIIPNYRKGI